MNSSSEETFTTEPLDNGNDSVIAEQELTRAKANRRFWIDRALLIVLVFLTAGTLIYGFLEGRNRAADREQRSQQRAAHEEQVLSQMDEILEEIRAEQEADRQSRYGFIQAVRLMLDAAGVEEDPFADLDIDLEPRGDQSSSNGMPPPQARMNSAMLPDAVPDTLFQDDKLATNGNEPRSPPEQPKPPAANKPHHHHHHHPPKKPQTASKPEAAPGPPGNAQGRDKPAHSPPGKAKGHSKAKAKGHSKANPPGKAKGHFKKSSGK